MTGMSINIKLGSQQVEKRLKYINSYKFYVRFLHLQYAEIHIT
jgi:hypothetical protein